MSLQKFCKRSVVTISPERNILEVCELLRKKNIGCLVAEDDGRLCGILTDRDVALKVTGESRDPRRTKVREVMTANPARISVDKSLHELTGLMHALHVRRVPVVDGNGKAIGIVTLNDIIVLLGDEMFEIGRTVSETFPVGTA